MVKRNIHQYERFFNGETSNQDQNGGGFGGDNPRKLSYSYLCEDNKEIVANSMSNQVGFEDTRWVRIINASDESVIELVGNKLITRPHDPAKEEFQSFQCHLTASGHYNIKSMYQMAGASIPSVWDYLPSSKLLVQRKQNRLASRHNQNWTSEALPGPATTSYFIISAPECTLCLKSMGIENQVKAVPKDSVMGDKTAHWSFVLLEPTAVPSRAALPVAPVPPIAINPPQPVPPTSVAQPSAATTIPVAPKPPISIPQPQATSIAISQPQSLPAAVGALPYPILAPKPIMPVAPQPRPQSIATPKETPVTPIQPTPEQSVPQPMEVALEQPPIQPAVVQPAIQPAAQVCAQLIQSAVQLLQQIQSPQPMEVDPQSIEAVVPTPPPQDPIKPPTPPPQDPINKPPTPPPQDPINKPPTPPTQPTP